jgi:hypothetical protein
MIKYIKLTTGEELITDIEDVDSDNYKLKTPVRVNVIPMPPDSDSSKFQVALFPFGTISKTHSVILKKTFVMWVEDPVDDLYDQYNENFGSGLKVVKKGGIVTP